MCLVVEIAFDNNHSDHHPGTGLFVGSGQVLAAAGPASLVISYCLVGIGMYCTVHALGEMAVLFPVAGSFSAYSTRFIDPAWGFAMGWKSVAIPLFFQWLRVLTRAATPLSGL